MKEEIKMSPFTKILIWTGLFLGVSGCASFKKQFCDCAKDPKAIANSAHFEKVPVEKKPSKESGPIVVDGDDVVLTNRMSAAVDGYVFKGEKEEFATLCADQRFDCFVNDRRFPKGRKRVKRKVPAFMSGSKMGLQNGERVRLKYDFYP
jgi:hypothetical protein